MTAAATLCIFNPEHDLCLANGDANYVPPQSAVDFALRSASVMQVLYPGACCCSVYDPKLGPAVLQGVAAIKAWGWNVVLRRELLKRGAPECLMPTDAELQTIRELQHRSTVLPLQGDCYALYRVDEMDALLRDRKDWVLKAPWSGAGRGLRWVHGRMSDLDRSWFEKTVASQRCVVAEPRRAVVADVALEYCGGRFVGYSYFRTGNGVYRENVMWRDEVIAGHFSCTDLQDVKDRVERWLAVNVWPRYGGPLGVDLIVGNDNRVFVSEINFRHTMGMVAHSKILQQ
ncbi:MAG: hypothetical protein IJK07_03330 [Bacteroidales bacterium]|nr:hypothetical protein [Bacteroidales bacterium]